MRALVGHAHKSRRHPESFAEYQPLLTPPRSLVNKEAQQGEEGGKVPEKTPDGCRQAKTAGGRERKKHLGSYRWVS